MGAEKASGVLASSQGNAFRAVAPGAKAGEFAKPAPVVTNTAAGANAGKENATTTRGAAAAASTSGEPDQPKSAGRCVTIPNFRQRTPARIEHAARSAFPARGVVPIRRVSQTDTTFRLDAHARGGGDCPRTTPADDADTRAASRARARFF